MTQPGLHRRFTPDECEQIFHAALGAGDIRGVEAALTLLAVQDPHRAQHLVDLTKMALMIREAGE